MTQPNVRADGDLLRVRTPDEWAVLTKAFPGTAALVHRAQRPADAALDERGVLIRPTPSPPDPWARVISEALPTIWFLTFYVVVPVACLFLLF